MSKSAVILLVVIGSVVAAWPAAAQRRGGGADPALPKKAATILYRQDFEKPELEFLATGYGSAKFLKGIVADVDKKAQPVGFALTRATPPETAFGSQGALKIAVTGSRATAGDSYVVAEREFDWTGDDATVAFVFYAHGITEFFVQAWAEKLNKNLHGTVKVERQDQWLFAKLPANSFIGWGSGALSAGEKFKNCMISISEFDPAVEKPYLLVDNFIVYAKDDEIPPTVGPKDVTATLAAETHAAVLTWTAAQDDLGVLEYSIYRAEQADFKPGIRNRVGVAATNRYSDPTVEGGKTYYYVVVGTDLGRTRVAADAVKVEVPEGFSGVKVKTEF